MAKFYLLFIWPENRKLCSVCIIRLFDHWPDNFVDMIRECKLRYTDLKGDSEERIFGMKR